MQSSFRIWRVKKYLFQVFDILPPETTCGMVKDLFNNVVNSKYAKPNSVAKFLSMVLTPKALPTLRAAYECTTQKLLGQFFCFKFILSLFEAFQGKVPGEMFSNYLHCMTHRSSSFLSRWLIIVL